MIVKNAIYINLILIYTLMELYNNYVYMYPREIIYWFVLHVDSKNLYKSLLSTLEFYFWVIIK